MLSKINKIDVCKYSVVLRIVPIIITLLILNNCDSLYLPEIKSGFNIPIKVITKNNKDKRKICCILPPGIASAEREKGIIYKEILIYKDNELLFEFTEEELNQLLSLAKDKYNVTWYIDENGLQLIGKGGKKIGEIKKEIGKNFR